MKVETVAADLSTPSGVSALLDHVRPGQPVRDFRRQWQNALEAGLAPGLLPYDLRRSALRNMVRGGTGYTVAMNAPRAS